MNALFVSDLHIDASTQPVFERFEKLLADGLDGIDALYVLGDLMEVWIGDDDDSEAAERLREVFRGATKRCSVHLMHGNRDFLFGERFSRDTGVALLTDPQCVEISSRRVLLAHGDAYCTGDANYQQARQLFRSPAWQDGVLAQSLPARRELARSLRQQSIDANANKADNIMDVAAGAISAAFAEHGADLMVHGHTHRPGIHDFDTADGTRRRYVLGAWGRCGWRLRLGDVDRLECFRV